MRLSCSAPYILALALSVSAVTFPARRVKRGSIDLKVANPGVVHPKVLAASKAASGGGGGLDLTTANDLIYIANITIGGVDYPVQLDTGSSDLWVKGPSFPLPNVNHTSSALNLTYGIGWAAGNLSTAAVEFAGLKIPQQALLDSSAAQNPALGYGATGILGLGFTSLSTIDSVVNKTGGSWGRSLLYSAFNVHPDEQNFITFALHRSSDPSDEVEGTFTLGEVDSNYTAISDSTSLPTWPIVAPNRWNVLLEAFIVGTQVYNVTSSVAGVPSGHSVVLLDSGTSFTYVPTEVAQVIYGNVPGAQFDSKSGLWVVPCEVEIDMALQLGGQIFPLHPLDVVPISPNNNNQCVGSFVPTDISVGNGQFDWLIGDNVLRSLYSLYDFGDFDSTGAMGNPYVKLLALIDPNEASADFTTIRGGTPRTNITYNVAPGTASSVGGSISVASGTASKLAQLVDYMPALLGILALNALALLAMAAVAVIYMCRKSKLRRSGAGKRRSTNGPGALALSGRTPTPYPGPMRSPSALVRRSSQLELVEAGRDEGEGDIGDASHGVYERVSVYAPPGEPEDVPFVPPEPAFHQGTYDGGDALRPRNGSGGLGARLQSPISPTRPRSMFSMASGSSGMAPMLGSPVRDYRVSTAGSDMTAFVPPSPGFAKNGNGRPKSFA